MPRFALKIEYDGAPFSGWQKQKAHPSVQQAVDDALRMLEPGFESVAAAGRTDTGVHATGQVAHCDLAKDWDPYRLASALNFHLKPKPIAILEAALVEDNFHARFSATGRRYLFRLQTRRAPATLERAFVWQITHNLDLEAMREGAQRLLGHHDFTTFRSTQCQATSPMKTLDRLDIEAFPIPYGTEYHFHVEARSFLHNQVRSFVGTLERVGAGGWAPERITTALEARDRAACGPVCPPHGLYLAEVHFAAGPFGAGADVPQP